MSFESIYVFRQLRRSFPERILTTLKNGGNWNTVLAAFENYSPKQK